MSIANNIRKLREGVGMSQTQLAKLLDVSPTTVNQWEHGKTKPRLDKVASLATLFGVKSSEIVDTEPDEGEIRYYMANMTDEAKATLLNVAKSLSEANPRNR